MVGGAFGAMMFSTEADEAVSSPRKSATTTRSVSRQLILLAAVNRSITHQQVALERMKGHVLRPSSSFGDDENDENDAGQVECLEDAILDRFECFDSVLDKLEESCRRFHESATTSDW